MFCIFCIVEVIFDYMGKDIALYLQDSDNKPDRSDVELSEESLLSEKPFLRFYS